jgi:hypothetical protein
MSSVVGSSTNDASAEEAVRISSSNTALWSSTDLDNFLGTGADMVLPSSMDIDVETFDLSESVVRQHNGISLERLHSALPASWSWWPVPYTVQILQL